MSRVQEQPKVPVQRAERPSMAALNAAYARVERAYLAARREVFDRYPDGLPNPRLLSVHQLDRLSELRVAESALDELRQRLH